MYVFGHNKTKWLRIQCNYAQSPDILIFLKQVTEKIEHSQVIKVLTCDLKILSEVRMPFISLPLSNQYFINVYQIYILLTRS